VPSNNLPVSRPSAEVEPASELLEHVVLPVGDVGRCDGADCIDGDRDEA
jgi:hypothetical protein